MNEIKNLKSEKVKEGLKSKSKENMDLNIPAIPEAPKKKDRITLDSPGLTTDLLSKIKKLEQNNIKVVLVNCERCREVIPVPIPKNSIKKSELPVVPISFVHKNPKRKDLHCITLHLDHDFDIRRQRISDVILDLE
ncbi:MAG: hypothetical protein ACTSPN_08945 [Promethearchaeota archaeon]